MPELYENYIITTVLAKRCINANGSGRGLEKEIVVRNYA